MRGDPGKGPAHTLPDPLDLVERCARDCDEGEIGMLEMLSRRVDVIGDEGAALAQPGGVRRQHEMIDGELAAVAKQICECAGTRESFELVSLVDLHPG